ncbi:MAG: hypothetical protein AB7O26_05180 [Planctomycetaceae bacterium]
MCLPHLRNLMMSAAVLLFPSVALFAADLPAVTKEDKSPSPESADQLDEPKQIAPNPTKRVGSIRDAAATAARVVAGMKTAEERISRKETGEETRMVQKQVIDDLQSLIDAASRMQQRQQSQQQQQSKQQQDIDSKDSEKQEQNPRDSGAGDQNRRKDEQGTNSTEAQGDSAKKDAAAEQQRKLLGEVWGHLPETLRQRLLNDLGEKTLPGYDDLVRRYFEALAEQPKTGSNSSEKKIK